MELYAYRDILVFDTVLKNAYIIPSWTENWNDK